MAVSNYSSCNSGGETYTKYEEFISHSVECPTCRGIGRVSRENEELVALIPLSDSRLKPRKTLLYIILAIIITVTAGGLLLFFLFERTISLSSNIQVIHPSNLTYIKDSVLSKLNLRFQVPVNISNDNYLPIEVSRLQISALLYGDYMLGYNCNETRLSIPMRSTAIHYVSIDVNIGDQPDLEHLADVCQGNAPVLWKLLMDFQVTANISYLSHTESSAIVFSSRRVCCHAPKANYLLPADFDECQ